MTTKTVGDIVALQKRWLADPSWNIYETEGFEGYYYLLKPFQDRWMEKSIQERMPDMKIEWECADCTHINQISMKFWKRIKDGQGFEDTCEKCGTNNEVDIVVETKSIAQNAPTNRGTSTHVYSTES